MLSRTDTITAYATRQFVREPGAWAAARVQGERLRAGMQMSAYEGALLQWLLMQHGAHRVLEIGTFMGLSALWMASALPPEGKVFTLERDAEHATLARAHTAHDARIEVCEGDALAWIDKNAAQHGPFDVLFIDGEKKAYKAYLDAALPHLRKGALVLVDNALLFGAVLGDDVRVSAAAKTAMTELHDALADSTRFRSILLPTTEGLIAAVVV